MDMIPTERKALALNLDDKIYGTFAEIGAGQEVARHFFMAGLASQTVAKTMSAYDMTFSDAIYGGGQRYVSSARLHDMLAHEYDLVIERLSKSRGDSTRFFAFADTVTTSSNGPNSHGWMGLRFANEAGEPFSQIVLHVKMNDSLRLQQQEALGILGVNLLYGAYFENAHPENIVAQLNDNIGNGRIEIDFIEFSGHSFRHTDNRTMALELIQNGLSRATLFSENGEIQMPSDGLYKKTVLVCRGTFRPITTSNLEILEKGMKHLIKACELEKAEPKILTEISMKSLMGEKGLDLKDFLDRVDTLSMLGYHVLVSDFQLYYELKNFLRGCTSEFIGMILGASHLEKIFDESHYKDLQGELLGAFAQLFDENTKMFVYPFQSDELCLTAKTFSPGVKLRHFYKHLIENEYILDLLDCESINTSIRSSDVRQMLSQGDSAWEKSVPSSVVQLIKEKKLFGYK